MEWKILKAMNDLTLAIFSTDDLEEMSTVVMKLLPELIPHEKSFFTLTPMGSRRRKTSFRSLTIPKKLQEEYIDRFEASDYTSWYLNQSSVTVYRDTQIITLEAMHASDIYQEWIAPMGMEYLCGNVIRDSAHRYAELTLMRSKRWGDYTDEELYCYSLVTDQMRLWFQRRFSVAYLNAAQAANAPMTAERILPLTRREQDVVQLIVAGLTTREISEYLSIALSTVRRHIANIYEKLGVSTRYQLVQKVEMSAFLKSTHP